MFIVHQILACCTTDELKSLMDNEEYAFRFDEGVSSASSSVTINDKEHIATALCYLQCQS